MTPSLRIGSDTLGWQEFGDVAVLGTRTKAMPGGDGSLEFVVPGDAAWQRRNVIVPEAVVKLSVEGEYDFGGYLVCDPLRHRLGAQDTLELAAAGPWSMAARDARYGYLGADSDLSLWTPTLIRYKASSSDLEPLEDAAKFATLTDGRLRIRAEGGRTFDDYAKVLLTLWLDSGLSGVEVVGVDFEYKSYLPGAWEARLQTCADPWNETRTDEWTETGDVSSWTSQQVDFTDPAPCLQLLLFWNSTGSTTPTSAPYVTLRNVTWYGRLSGSAVDRSVTIADILGDCATALGITSTRISGLTTALAPFRVAYPASYADVMSAAVMGENAPVEVYVDLAPDGSFRLTANARPSTVNATRNRLWSVGGRAGEDVSELVRDWEATPEQVQVLYAVKGHATYPDGTPQTAAYPASVTSSYPLIETVDLTDASPMSASVAAAYAQTLYTAREESSYSGDVVLPETALTSTGQEVPTVKLRPGDRLHVPCLLDCPSAGLYVQAVSYDYQTRTCTATVGEPWDPLALRPRPLSAPHGGGLGHVDRPRRPGGRR